MQNSERSHQLVTAVMRIVMMIRSSLQ